MTTDKLKLSMQHMPLFQIELFIMVDYSRIFQKLTKKDKEDLD